MKPYPHFNSTEMPKYGIGRSHVSTGKTLPPAYPPVQLRTASAAKRARLLAVLVAAAALGGVALPLAPRAQAKPAPEVEYVYNVVVRRHYNFPNNDAIGYGYGICDKVRQGDSYAKVMGDTKRDVSPNDEFAANYLVSYAVDLFCPDQIWQLRNSAAHYRPPADA